MVIFILAFFFFFFYLSVYRNMAVPCQEEAEIELFFMVK